MDTYEKKFNEALSRAKKLHETCDSQAVVGWCEYIFPELKENEENEDEKTMKDLLNFLKSSFITDNICYWKVEPWIDWIEKHGEGENIDYKEELKKCRENPLYFFNKYVKIKDKKPVWKPTKEQKQALYEETQKSDRIRDERIVSIYNDLKKLEGE